MKTDDSPATSVAAGDRQQVRALLERYVRSGEPQAAERCLVEFPLLAADPDAALDLLYTEFLLRERLGQRPAPENWYARFPDRRADLEQVFQVHDDLDSGAGETAALQPSDAPAREVADGVGRYELLEEIGRGGVGVVYRARDRRLGRQVAVKFLHAERARQPEALERFRREARAASSLSNPHICTVYELDERAGDPFITMELVEGQTLQQRAAGGLTLADAAAMMAQVARALAAAHAAGIVHRDIKPGNLMVTPDGRVKVLDFGMAGLLPGGSRFAGIGSSTMTIPGSVFGTVAYMSPEQARGEPVCGASDVFSLGVVLYELATGRHPFEAASPAATLHAVLSQAVLPPSRLNPAVTADAEDLIFSMLARDARLRPGPLEVATALDLWAVSPAGPSPTVDGPAAAGEAVGRETEFASMRAAFAAAAAGRGRMLCVSGEPGIGKTTLVEAFLAEVSAASRACAVARGRCSERLAGAEAFLPVLEALESLLGGEACGSMTRLMRALAPTWFAQVAPLAGGTGRADAPADPARASSQERMKREVLAFLQEATRTRPIVLFFDDLHWADPSTVDLLAYLGRRCVSLRLLLITTYRPTDLVLANHPMLPVRQELQSHGACHEINVGFLGRSDVEAYLAREFPGNAFPPNLAAFLHDRTSGNPLFLVSLTQYLRGLGVIAPGPVGSATETPCDPAAAAWVLGRSVGDLARELELPESVRSMVRRKIDQLPDADRRLLAAASVQGAEFDASVVARAAGLSEIDVEDRLGEIDRLYGVVRRIRELEFPDGSLTVRYAFVHALYQNALYGSLQPARRAALSTTVADALIAHHGGIAAPALAAELALLLEAARDFARAAECHLQAAENAARLFAYQEAAAWSRRGLGMIHRLPDSPERMRRELRLRVTLGIALQATSGFAAPAVAGAFGEALALGRRAGEPALLFRASYGLWLYYAARGDYQTDAHALAGELLDLAGRAEAAAQPDAADLLLQARQAMGMTLFHRGEHAPALEHFDLGVPLFDPGRHGAHAFLYGQNPAVLCLGFGAMALWFLGRPDQAAARAAEARRLAESASDPPSAAFALFLSTWVNQCRRDAGAVAELAAASAAASTEFPFWTACATFLAAWSRAERGDLEAGIVGMREGMAAFKATGGGVLWPYFLALLAEALARNGRPAEARAAVAEALDVVAATGNRYFEAELHRISGELSGVGGGEAEACFERALDVARRQGAASLELRAATSLARFHLVGGDPTGRAGSLRLLAATHARFREGFDTPDLRAAAALLEGTVGRPN